MTKKLTTEEFIKRAREVHGDLYNYDEVNYIDSYTPIIISCNRCGKSFLQKPHNHLCGFGCSECGRKERDDKRKLSLKEFIDKAIKIHGNLYDYSKVNYINYNSKIKIICNKCHQSFWQTPHSHLKGEGCSKCAEKQRHISKTFTTEKYIQKAKELYSDRYEYDKTIYNGMKNDVEIYCPKCQKYFWQNAKAHLNNHGCPNCAKIIRAEKNRKTLEQFIQEAKDIHRNDYDYTKVEYIDTETKVEIICNKCHQSFWQTPHSHLRDDGCPYCKQSKGEKLIRNILNDNHIEFESQKRFKDCRDNKPLSFDFYLPTYNLCIEFQGEQHYRPFYHKNMNEEKCQKLFEKQQLHDKIKRDYCKINNIKLLEIRYNEDALSKLKGEINEIC